MRISNIVLVVITCLGLQGCIAVAAVAVAGVGYDMHERNEHSMDVPAGMRQTWKATVHTLRGMGYPVADDLPPLATERVVDLEEQNVWVKVERHAENLTKVLVRVGTFYSKDNERRSKLILKSIRRNLD